MNYVDITIIAIIAIFALLGLWKGFGKTAIKFACFALAILVTWALVSVVVDNMLGVAILRKLVVGSDGISLYSAYYRSFGEEILSATADTRLSGAMGLYINPMIERFTAMGGPEVYGIGYAEFIAVMLSINTLSVFMCLIMYAVIRIVAHLLAWILRKIFIHDGPVRVWSRLVGFVLGGARGVAVVMALLILSTIVFPFGFAQSYAKSVGDGLIGSAAAKATYAAFDGAVYGGSRTERTEKLLAAAGYSKEAVLASAVTEAKAELDARFTELAGSDPASSPYSEEKYGALSTARDTGKANIDAATSVADVESRKADALAAMNAIPTRLQECKNAANATLMKKYNSLENRDAFLEQYTAGVGSIASAATEEDVASALAAALASLGIEN